MVTMEPVGVGQLLAASIRVVPERRIPEQSAS
jgi:hypothetical protein